MSRVSARQALVGAMFASLASLPAGACSRVEETAHTRTALANDSGLVARVGDVAIGPEEIRALMAAQKIDARLALERLVRDSALASTVSAEQSARLARLVRARRVLESLRAAAQTPPTEAEVAQFTERHWLELDRPESFRVTHAVVVCEDCPDRDGARALAERLATALRGLTDAAAFKSAAAAVPAGSFKVVAEDLDPVAADGRTVDLERRGQSSQEGGKLHLAFAQAAARLQHVGEQSPVVQSPSGFHVLLLTERLPELRVPFDERARALTPEIQSARAKAAEEQLLGEAKQRWPVEVLRSVAQDTELILPKP